MIRIICKMKLPLAVWPLCKNWQKNRLSLEKGTSQSTPYHYQSGSSQTKVEPDRSLCCRSAPLNDVDHLQNEISFCRPSSLQELPAMLSSYRLSSFVCFRVFFIVSVRTRIQVLFNCLQVGFVLYCFYPYRVIFAAGCELPVAQFSCSLSSFVCFGCVFVFIVPFHTR